MGEATPHMFTEEGCPNAEHPAEEFTDAPCGLCGYQAPVELVEFEVTFCHEDLVTAGPHYYETYSAISATEAETAWEDAHEGEPLVVVHTREARP
jgi:hypothetical protein